MFDKEMSDPRKSITDDESEWNQPEIAGENSADQATEACATSNEMQQPATPGRMLAYIEKPELLKCFYSIRLVHCGLPGRDYEINENDEIYEMIKNVSYISSFSFIS